LREFSDSVAVVAADIVWLLHSLRFVVQLRASLHLEIIALRHQLAVIHRSVAIRQPAVRVALGIPAAREPWGWWRPGPDAGLCRSGVFFGSELRAV
jgi:hypothetical protein